MPIKPQYKDKPQYKAVYGIEESFQKKAEKMNKEIVKQISNKLNDTANTK